MLDQPNDERVYTGGRNKWGVLVAVSLALFLGSVDGSIVNVALPTLMAKLQTDFPTIQWVVLAYLLGLTLFSVSAGRLADLYGKKRIFVGGIALFLIGSICCSLAPTARWLIGFRFVQSIGAAMMLALGIAIITDVWPMQERGKAIGIASGVIGFGIVLGPAVGGFVLDKLPWGWIFLVNLPAGVLAFLLSLYYVPRSSARRLSARTSSGSAANEFTEFTDGALPTDGSSISSEYFDLAGAAALGVGLLSLAMALTLGQNQGFGTLPVRILFAAALVALPLFVWIEQRVAHPVVDLSLFRNAQFSLNLFINWLVFVAIAAIVLLLPFYLELVLKLPLRQVGIMMAVVTVMMGIMQPIAGALSDRVGVNPMILTGLLLLVFGYILASTLRIDGSQMGFVFKLLPVVVGISTFNSPNNSAIMEAAPRHQLGVASGILSMTRILGQITGISVLGAFFNVRIQAHAANAALPLAVTDNLRTLPPAITVAALRDQFLFVAALMAAGLLLIVWRMRRHA